MTRLMLLVICLLIGLPALAQDRTTETDLKTRFITALEDNPNSNTIDSIDMGPSFAGRPPQVFRIIEELKREHAELLQNDNIRTALKKLRDRHPVNAVRSNAKAALNGTTTPTGFGGYIDKTRKYCSAKDAGATALPKRCGATISSKSSGKEELFMDLEGVSTRGTFRIKDIPIHAERLSEGWLTGYGQGAFGLHYIPDDEARPTQPLISGNIHAILPTHCDKTFYIFSTNDPRSPWQQCNVTLDVWKIREKASGGFVISTFRTLPDRFRSIGQMDNGDLFLSFGTPKQTGCRSASMPMERPAYSNNPPIGFTRTGRIYSVCEGDGNGERF